MTGNIGCPLFISNLEDIFKPRLWILEGNCKGHKIEVICSKSDTSFEYCGGELNLTVKSAKVTDQLSRNYTIDELSNTCESYWDEWEKSLNNFLQSNCNNIVDTVIKNATI
ncbi:MAG: hypothetical protein JRF71_14505 [Deltaproteobacteria bacterium]|nr:hypothetical protein [Deltaproteobacteria bacterium]